MSSVSRPCRIGVIMQGGAGWAGGSEYIRNLVLAFSQLPAGERMGIELCLISGAPLEPKLAQQLHPHLAHCYTLATDLPVATLPNRARWLVDRRLRGRPNTRFGEFVSTEGFDFLYPLTYDNQYNIGVALPLGKALKSCRWAGWIPDFQHRFMPELFNSAEIAKRDTGIGLLAREATTIVLSSESAAEDFRRFYPAAGARPQVLHFHTHPDSAWFEHDPAVVQQQFHLPAEFLLVSNQFWQHKNHRTLFAALALLRKREVKPALVCTGQTSDFRKKDYFNSLLRQVHESGIAAQVYLLGLIERSEQIQLMRRSLAVIQPSLFEGWSTVLEDARALGKRVIASDIAVHREQNLPGARYFSKDSPEALADAIAATLLECSAGPDLAREAGARAAAQSAILKYGRDFLEIVRDSVK
jgi:glycosyltransferase involved in cell wall biosynthesis